MMPFDVGLLTLGFGGSIGLLAGAFALGLRHGIDWDHIAATTDITSTTANQTKSAERFEIVICHTEYPS